MKKNLKNKNRWIAWLLAAALLALSLTAAGCGSVSSTAVQQEQAEKADQDSRSDAQDTAKQEGEESGDSTDQAGSTVGTKSFTDDCDREVEVPEKLTHVVASGSVATIALYAIAPDALMAIPDK